MIRAGANRWNILKKTSRGARLFAASLPPFIVLIACLLLTGLLTQWSAYDVERESRLRFDLATQRLQRAILFRMETYRNGLLHFRGAFAINPNLQREDFHDFVSSLEIQRRYPGIRGINFARRLMPGQLKQHVSEVRAQGLTDYRVWPATPREEFFPIVYLEPFNANSRHALGFDPSTEESRRSAMERARDSGDTAATRVVTLLQDRDPRPQPAFVVYVPIYQGGGVPETLEARRERLFGFAIAVFRTHDLFGEITKEIAADSPLAFSIRETGAKPGESPIFAFGLSETPQTQWPFGPQGYSAHIPIEFAGASWMLDIKSDHSFVMDHTRRVPWYVLGFGLVVSFLAFRLSRASETYTEGLKRSEDQLRVVTNSLPALVAYIDRMGIYQFANAAHEDWFGIASEAIPGRSFWEIVQGDFSSPERASFVASVLQGQAASTEATLTHSTLGERRVRIECRPDINRGQVIGIVALVLDTTEKYEWTEKLKADKLSLEKAVVENARLLDEAQSLNRAKDEFLATLSHELRTPLSVIQGHAELLKAGCSNAEDAEESVDSIFRNAKIQTQIVNDLLDVSSIVTGKVDIERVPLLVRDVLLEALESLKLNAMAKMISVSFDVSEEDLEIDGDPVRLQQIFWNLLSNAFKFTPDNGEIRISIQRAEAGAGLGDSCEIIVEDSGQGIEPAFLPFVFDRFRQEDSSTTRKFGGLGLGLSIVKNLVGIHGGTVRAESAGRGCGARFIVRLPLRAEAPRQLEFEA